MTTIHRRSEWATRALTNPAPQRGVPYGRLHHEGGPVRGNPSDKAGVLRSIEAAVIPKGYVAIDYNLMVFQDGSIWEGRGLDHEDAATLNHNADSVSVCAVGNFEIEQPTDALLHGIADAFRLAIDTGWMAVGGEIHPHSDTFQTACPGAHLRARMNDIRARFANTAPDPGNPPSQEDIVYTIYQNQLHGFYIGKDKRLWQRLEDTSGSPVEHNISAAAGISGDFDVARPVACHAAPNGDLVVGAYGVDGTFNEVRWSVRQAKWFQKVWH